MSSARWPGLHRSEGARLLLLWHQPACSRSQAAGLLLERAWLQRVSSTTGRATAVVGVCFAAVELLLCLLLHVCCCVCCGASVGPPSQLGHYCSSPCQRPGVLVPFFLVAR